MTINNNQIIGKVYQIINVVNSCKGNIKNLNQKERSIVMFALKLINQTNPVELTNTQKNQIDKIYSKLMCSAKGTSTHNHFFSFMKSVIKGFLNLIHARISSKQIDKEFLSTKEKIEFNLNNIPKEIEKKEAQIKEWKDLLEFNPNAIRKYEDLISFFKKLPENMEEAIEKLNEKINEVEEKILPPIIEDFKKEFKIKKGREPTEKEIKGGYVHLIRGEILASLKSMANCPKSIIKTSIIEYQNALIKKALQEQGVDVEKELKRDIEDKRLSANAREQIIKDVNEKKQELENTVEGKAEIEKRFVREKKVQIEAYESSVVNANHIEKQAQEHIQNLELEIGKLELQLAKIKTISEYA